jgi:hypothetical protein
MTHPLGTEDRRGIPRLLLPQARPTMTTRWTASLAQPLPRRLRPRRPAAILRSATRRPRLPTAAWAPTREAATVATRRRRARAAAQPPLPRPRLRRRRQAPRRRAHRRGRPATAATRRHPTDFIARPAVAQSTRPQPRPPRVATLARSRVAQLAHGRGRGVRRTAARRRTPTSAGAERPPAPSTCRPRRRHARPGITGVLRSRRPGRIGCSPATRCGGSPPATSDPTRQLRRPHRR